MFSVVVVIVDAVRVMDVLVMVVVEAMIVMNVFGGFGKSKGCFGWIPLCLYYSLQLICFG